MSSGRHLAMICWNFLLPALVLHCSGSKARSILPIVGQSITGVITGELSVVDASDSSYKIDLRIDDVIGERFLRSSGENSSLKRISLEAKSI
mmetsp:Transcript_31866/g.31582  ORF Transcript_31866/g.31582 Transcript_31866/m.31582 type:complete len:92 (+) Transcript_31866:452-727(+)